MNYNLTLTAQEINLIKSKLSNEVKELNGKEEIEAYHNSLNDLFFKISYQLSDQQNIGAPLSQREYPQ